MSVQKERTVCKEGDLHWRRRMNKMPAQAKKDGIRLFLIRSAPHSAAISRETIGWWVC